MRKKSEFVLRRNLTKSKPLLRNDWPSVKLK